MSPSEEVPNAEIKAAFQKVDDAFMYRVPTQEQIASMQLIRNSARELAKSIVLLSPKCADTSAALRKLRECVMTVNAAIVSEGQSL